jgi:putative transposase
MPPANPRRRHAINSATFYNGSLKFGALQVSDAKRLRSVEEEEEDAKPKKLAEAILHIAVKDLAAEITPCAKRLLAGSAI